MDYVFTTTIFDKHRPSHREIRVLDLLPGKELDSVRCTIRLLGLDSNEEYEALSYVWGPRTHEELIEVAGHPIRITRNLHDALRRLRDPNTQRTVWIDQLCINQLDNDDKAHQVAMMRDIYRGCSRCIIWLGEIEEGNVNFNVHDARDTFEFIEFAANPVSTSPEYLPHLFQDTFRGERARSAFEALSMYGNPWWSRIWTIQEAIVPSSGLYVWGPLSIPREMVIRTAQNLRGDRMPQLFSPNFCHHRLLHTPLLRRMLYPVHGFLHSSTIDGPLDLLMRWRHRDATDPRDKVYALMGLTKDDALPSAREYNYKISPSLLFANVTFNLIQEEKGLRPLLGSCEMSHKTPDLPTFAIDFANTNRVGRLQLKWWNHSHRYHEFSACGERTIEARLLHDGACLALKGVLVDEIEETSDVYVLLDDEDIDPYKLCDTIMGWNSRLSTWCIDRNKAEQYVAGGSYLSAFSRTCIGDLIKAEFPIERARPLHEKQFFKLLKLLSKGQTQNPLYESVCGMVPNQALFITKLGYIGIGPPDAQAGDQVWVFYGGQVPFFLRKTNPDNVIEGNHKLTLVGDAYVHGIMDGEAVDGKFQEQSVWLV
ncbi:HET-domain-containing protein [Ophiobolus disseminans]|uniref:HET-domain-containing protein n=1 Tax=Ophiobolus disseminans TaxID=1469910 RepID=A0A6A6ZK89_9PLEO|nr:HET-domain-containing protein [Ophiobolus disseminans]